MGALWPDSHPLVARFMAGIDMDAQDALILAQQFTRRQLAAEEHWIVAGERNRTMCIVETGLMRVYYTDAQGRERNQHFYQEGEGFAPIAAIMTQEAVRYGVQALEPTTLWVADYDRLEALSEDYPDWTRIELNLIKAVFVKNAKHEAQLLLSDGARRYRWFCKEYPELLERLPQYHIAAFLGITPVSLSRLRKKG